MHEQMKVAERATSHPKESGSEAARLLDSDPPPRHLRTTESLRPQVPQVVHVQLELAQLEREPRVGLLHCRALELPRVFRALDQVERARTRRPELLRRGVGPFRLERNVARPLEQGALSQVAVVDAKDLARLQAGRIAVLALLPRPQAGDNVVCNPHPRAVRTMRHRVGPFVVVEVCARAWVWICSRMSFEMLTGSVEIGLAKMFATSCMSEIVSQLRVENMLWGSRLTAQEKDPTDGGRNFGIRWSKLPSST